MAAIDDWIAASAEPRNAAIHLRGFVEAGGSVPAADDEARLLATLLASGSYLPGLLVAEPARFVELCRDRHLGHEKPAELFAREAAAAVAGARDFAELQRALRRYARGQMLRLGARQLGWGSTESVARELSHLADACLAQATLVCERLLQAQHGVPRADSGDAPAFVVLAMGKLGGQELNFSSDVDLIYLYSTDEGRAGALSLHEYYVQLCRLITRALDEATGDGFVFRVDLRLRPEGRSGPLCNALPAAERYYETFGRTWERQALLRARPCAGDRALGERFLRVVEPFVYRRSLDARAVDDVLGLRQMFRAKSGDDGFDVKLSPGGIRDVELVAQLLQLIHGGRRADLRARDTASALQRLFVAGLLSERERHALLEAYRFLRTLEHHLQLENAAQTQRLPSDPVALSRLARQLRFSDEKALLAQVAHTRAEVTAIAATLGEPAEGVPPEVLRLLDPARAPEALDEDLRRAGFCDVESSRRALEAARARMPERWLAEAISSVDPDRALRHFGDLVLHGSQGLHSLVSSHAQLPRMLAGLFGTSERLSRLLIAEPALWEPLLLGLGVPRPPSTHWDASLAERLAALLPDDEESHMREMRRFLTEELLRIGLHDVAGTLAPDEVSAQLVGVAEACVRVQVALAARQLAHRFGTPDAELTVLGLGSVGAREMRYGSDLDLVFLFAQPGTTSRGMEHQEWFARLAQRMIAQLGAWMPEGRLYEVDTRLRPSGQQGLLVTTYGAFAAYHERQAAPWERAALLRARPLYCGNLATGETGDGIAAVLREAAYGHALEASVVRAELGRIRARIESERAGRRARAWHLRLSPGGLTDGEFLAAYGQLCFGATQPGLQVTAPAEALAALVDGKLLPIAPELLDDYAWLRRVGMRIRLLRDDRDCEEWLPFDGDRVLARTLGMTSEAVLERTRVAMARMRAAYTEVFGDG